MPEGGTPFPAYGVYRAFHRHFAPGTRLVRARSSSPRVAVLASRRAVLLINRRPEPVAVAVGGRRAVLGRYGVRVLART